MHGCPAGEVSRPEESGEAWTEYNEGCNPAREGREVARDFKGGPADHEAGTLAGCVELGSRGTVPDLPTYCKWWTWDGW